MYSVHAERLIVVSVSGSRGVRECRTCRLASSMAGSYCSRPSNSDRAGSRRGKPVGHHVAGVAEQVLELAQHQCGSRPMRRCRSASLSQIGSECRISAKIVAVQPLSALAIGFVQLCACKVRLRQCGRVSGQHMMWARLAHRIVIGDRRARGDPDRHLLLQGLGAGGGGGELPELAIMGIVAFPERAHGGQHFLHVLPGI